MAVTEILPDVHLPAPQKGNGQQVFHRLALEASQPRGAQENEDTGGKGDSGRGERQAWAMLPESPSCAHPSAKGCRLQLLSPSGSNYTMIYPLSGTIWRVHGDLSQGHSQQL